MWPPAGTLGNPHLRQQKGQDLWSQAYMSLMSDLPFSKVLWLRQFYSLRWALVPSYGSRDSNICQGYCDRLVSCNDSSAEWNLPTLETWFIATMVCRWPQGAIGTGEDPKYYSYMAPVPGTQEVHKEGPVLGWVVSTRSDGNFLRTGIAHPGVSLRLWNITG